MTSSYIEFRLAQYFGWRAYMIIPNVSWGLDLHECDLLIMTKAGYLTEIEIKISKADLKRDQHKFHGHRSSKIKYLYFAVPEDLKEFALSNIPERAGLFIIYNQGGIGRGKKPILNKQARALPPTEQVKFLRLGVMRFWNLREIQFNRAAAADNLISALGKE